MKTRPPDKQPPGRPRQVGTDADPATHGNVQLLASQWQWLRTQPAGISPTLRALITQAQIKRIK